MQAKPIILLTDSSIPVLSICIDWANKYSKSMMHRAAHLIERIGKITFTALLRGVFLFLVSNTIIFFYYAGEITTSPENLTSTGDAVLILGASVKGNKLSQIVQDRAETAIQVYTAKKAEKLLISGYGNPKQYYNETEAIKNYLINRGIPPHNIFVDTHGLDTYDSIWRAKHIFQVKSLIIATQRFHLPRALLISHALGIETQGIIADRTIYPSAEKNALRESFARIKAIGNIIISNQINSYSGDTIDIHGNGNASTED